MIDKERIIFLAEEKLFSLVDKDFSDWDENDRLEARDKFDSTYSYSEDLD